MSGTRSDKMIIHTSFKHGWFYHYRIYLEKMNSLCPPSLSEYLQRVFQSCPDEKFNSGPRSSSLRINLNINPIEVNGHEVSTFASLALNHPTHYKTNHSKVQVFMLERDPKTVAMEVPIWFTEEEMEPYRNVFPEEGVLSGHIDLLRMENGKIWIWDYKPNAYKEKYATTQVLFYALMLSKITSLPLENFMCGYFDHNNTYIFQPKEELLLPILEQKTLN